MSGEIEKRRHHRFMALLEVRVRSGPAASADGLKLVTLDVALGGARCACNRELPAGTSLHLVLTLEGGGLNAPLPIDLDATVLRCRETPGPDPARSYEAALQFVRIDPQDRKRLQSYLNDL
ncbi:MAG TPA: PilZ domain-containing protein [Candidatus Polarisedimenticolia bacterium]|nr:PilZ domain-containing protein [Candidatus Polarisedimenticolia bacterium]